MSLDYLPEHVENALLALQLVHEYMSDAELFLEALLSAKGATEMLFEIIRRVTSEAVRLGITPPG